MIGPQIACMCMRADRGCCGWVRGTHTFFLPPFLPFEIRLFLPTAMLGNRHAPLLGAATKEDAAVGEPREGGFEGALCAKP